MKVEKSILTQTDLPLSVSKGNGLCKWQPFWHPNCLCRCMKRYCPYSDCPSSKVCPKIGFYVRRSDSRSIQRFRCGCCRRDFSQATFDPRFRQKKRRINSQLARLLCSGVSQRRAALLLNVHPVTIARKFRFLAKQSRADHLEFIEGIRREPIEEIQFDDVETFEHSKHKPLAVAIAVDAKSRSILGVQVSEITEKRKGSGTKNSRRGFRKDQRRAGLSRLFETLRPVVNESTLFRSDRHPFYAGVLNRVFPGALHRQEESRRGRAAGLGELKTGGFDPLFSLNHTAAMLRANINRLFRRTWCTTKDKNRLLDHLFLYASFHNRVLTGKKGQTTDASRSIGRR